MSPGRPRARWWGVTVLVLLTIAKTTPAGATQGHVRVSHGEPLNDLHLTPGATFRVTVSTVCVPGYAARMRHVTTAQKNAVYADYGITHRVTNEYEIDHLIPLELGGDNALANLWPQLNDHPRGYLNSKDRLENVLHVLVCSHRLSLRPAQTQIATDWVATYHRYLGTWPRGSTSFSTSPTSPAPPASSATIATGAPPSSHLVITSLVRVVGPGQPASLSVRSPTPHDACTLEVTLPSGRRSTASGLGPATTDAHGAAAWTWWIGSRTDAGTAHVTVQCGSRVAYGTFVIR